MRPVASDHRGGRRRGAGWMDAVTRQSHRRCAVAVGGLVHRVLECHRLQLQLRLAGGRRCVGGHGNHGTCLSSENIDNADNPSKVAMPRD